MVLSNLNQKILPFGMPLFFVEPSVYHSVFTHITRLIYKLIRFAGTKSACISCQYWFISCFIIAKAIGMRTTQLISVLFFKFYWSCACFLLPFQEASFPDPLPIYVINLKCILSHKNDENFYVYSVVVFVLFASKSRIFNDFCVENWSKVFVFPSFISVRPFSNP